MNRTDPERFEQAYRSVWGALHRRDDPDLSQHERQLLHHLPTEGDGVSLTELAAHLALPKSSASVLVKSLARRGFVRRARSEADERRLDLLLTEDGARRVAADTVLEPQALATALRRLDRDTRAALLDGFEALAAAAARGGGRRSHAG